MMRTLRCAWSGLLDEEHMRKKEKARKAAYTSFL
jgi:hypothetical protein